MLTFPSPPVVRVATLLLLFAGYPMAATIDFDLSPLDTTAGIGLSPLNEFLAGCPTCGGNGSGNEIGTGIMFDPAASRLSFEIGYGSVAGFTDLTDAAFAWYWHGPATPAEAGEILRDLAPFHEFGAMGTDGGFLRGSLTLEPEEARYLLDGLSYLNIYTATFPGGELRAQLYQASVPEPTPFPVGIAALGWGVWQVVRRYRRGSGQTRAPNSPDDRMLPH